MFDDMRNCHGLSQASQMCHERARGLSSHRRGATRPADIDAAGCLIDLIRMVDSIPVEGETSVRIDDGVLKDFFNDRTRCLHSMGGTPIRCGD